MLNRTLESLIELSNQKATIILGARQVGKTTLVKKILKNYKNIQLFNGDEEDTHFALDKMTSANFRSVIKEDTKIIFIDEAQRIDNIGIKLKIIIDNINDLTVIATGSSSFELRNKISESLAGRKFEYQLFPFSFKELSQNSTIFEEQKMLMNRIIFGSYPDVINNPAKEERILKQITESILYKDILNIEGIKSSSSLNKLIKALAYQIGSQVSYSELGNLVGISNKTVEKYIDVLEKSFIIFQVYSYSKNLRNELKKQKKIYFYDNGLRNSIISNFSKDPQRQDLGHLFENFIISERMKVNHYKEHMPIFGFWRNKQGAEIDFIEEKDGKIECYEIKYNPTKKAKVPQAFSNNYKNFHFNIVNSYNFPDFLT